MSQVESYPPEAYAQPNQGYTQQQYQAEPPVSQIYFCNFYRWLRMDSSRVTMQVVSLDMQTPMVSSKLTMIKLKCSSLLPTNNSLLMVLNKTSVPSNSSRSMLSQTIRKELSQLRITRTRAHRFSMGSPLSTSTSMLK